MMVVFYQGFLGKHDLSPLLESSEALLESSEALEIILKRFF